MRKHNTSLIIVLVTLSVAAAISFLLASSPLAASGDAPGDFPLAILHTNDLHAHVAEYNVNGSNSCAGTNCIGGSARLATLIQQARSTFSNTLLLDAGDQFQGTLYYNLFKSDIVTRTMNALGYDAMTLGNHEFDDGPNETARLIAGVNFPVVSANIDASANPTLSGRIKPSTIVTLSGEPVGIVGATTDETPILSSPGPTLRFTSPITPVQQAINDLVSRGVNKIVVLSHLGYDVDLALAQAITGADVIVGGHTHTFLYTPVITQANGDIPAGPYPTLVQAPDGNNVLVVTAASWGRYLGAFTITFSLTGTVSAWNGDPISTSSAIPQDPTVLGIISPTYSSQVAAIQAQPVGSSTVPMPVTTGGTQICRVGECLVGNFVADAMVWKINQTITHTRDQYPIALITGGSLRAPLAVSTSTVTLGDVMTLLPFGNTLATFDITGTYILTALENGVSAYGTSSGTGRFPQVSGLRFTWNPSATVGSRVKSVMVRTIISGGVPPVAAWEPLSPTRVYKIVTINFVRTGGDGYSVFATQAIKPYDFGPDIADATADYLKQFSPVSPQLEGRIIALTSRKYLPLID